MLSFITFHIYLSFSVHMGQNLNKVSMMLELSKASGKGLLLSEF